MLARIFKGTQASFIYGLLFVFFVNLNLDLLDTAIDLHAVFRDSFIINMAVRTFMSAIAIIMFGEKSYQALRKIVLNEKYIGITK